MDQIWNKFYDSVIASINNSSEKYLSIQEAIGQGHSTNLFLQISVLGTTSCWLANYFCVATLLGNNHWRFFPGKIISRWRRPGLKDWSLLRDWVGAVAADRTNCFSRKPFPPKNFGGYGLRSRLRPFTSVYRSVHYGFFQTKGRHVYRFAMFYSWSVV